MITQINFDHLSYQDLFFLLPVQPDAYSWDDEEHLAAEMTRTAPENLPTEPPPKLDADDFERLYQWFLA